MSLDTQRLIRARRGSAEIVERKLRELLKAPDETDLDPAWAEAQERVLELALRPAKRIRPQLLWMGYRLAGGTGHDDGVWTFATGLELLHTFLLIHDDIADRSPARRGGETLHRAWDAAGIGGDLATVAGDHLFARAVELLVTAPVPAAVAASTYYLRICRHTAAGQYLDLLYSRRPLSELTPFDALKVCKLKTAKYSVAAPLACGAMLAGRPDCVAPLEQVGLLAGVAFQLRDDLLGVFGPEALGKPVDGDLREGKRTFPLLVAFRRASAAERKRIERLGPQSTEAELSDARRIIRDRGGVATTERAISRITALAQRAIAALPMPAPERGELAQLVSALAQRAS